jgi:hypothetical protein
MYFSGVDFSKIPRLKTDSCLLGRIKVFERKREPTCQLPSPLSLTAHLELTVLERGDQLLAGIHASD